MSQRSIKYSRFSFISPFWQSTVINVLQWNTQTYGRPANKVKSINEFKGPWVETGRYKANPKSLDPVRQQCNISGNRDKITTILRERHEAVYHWGTFPAMENIMCTGTQVYVNDG